jgi:hypothetical protein
MGQVACEPQGATSELGIPPTSLQIGPPHNSRSHPQRSVALRLRNAFILESSDLLKLILALSRPKGEAACSEGQSPPVRLEACLAQPSDGRGSLASPHGARNRQLMAPIM